jgi:uncharacterized membrane protein YhaH (DUF805 family)
MALGALLFSFHGRINRAKYWLAALIYFIVGSIVLVIGLLSGQIVPGQIVSAQSAAFQVLNFVVDLGCLVSGLAVGAKRLHDRDRSAWWLLLFFGAPWLLGIIAGTAFALGVWLTIEICGVALILIGLWAFIEFGCLRGTVGPNAYGPDPLATA